MKVNQWSHIVTLEAEGLGITAAYMGLRKDGEFVAHTDYARLEAENERLRSMIETFAVSVNKLEAENDAALKQVEALTCLLREVSGEWRIRQPESLLKRIDATLRPPR